MNTKRKTNLIFKFAILFLIISMVGSKVMAAPLINYYLNVKDIVLLNDSYDEFYDINNDGVVNVFDAIRINKNELYEENHKDLLKIKSEIIDLKSDLSNILKEVVNYRPASISNASQAIINNNYTVSSTTSRILSDFLKIDGNCTVTVSNENYKFSVFAFKDASGTGAIQIGDEYQNAWVPAGIQLKVNSKEYPYIRWTIAKTSNASIRIGTDISEEDAINLVSVTSNVSRSDYVIDSVQKDIAGLSAYTGIIPMSAFKDGRHNNFNMEPSKVGSGLYTYFLGDSEELPDDYKAIIYNYGGTYIKYATTYYNRDGRACFQNSWRDANESSIPGIASRDTLINTLDKPDYKYFAISFSFSDTGDVDENGNFTNPIKVPDDFGVYLRPTKSSNKKNITTTVAQDGSGDYLTVSDAVNATSDGDTILIGPGEYNETVHMWGKNRNLVGVCKESCIIITKKGIYAEPPLEANIGSLENLTLIADTSEATIRPEDKDSKAYAMHVEYGNSTPYSLNVRNCRFVSNWTAAVGMGIRHNQTVTFDGCEFISNAEMVWSNYRGEWIEMGALYYHNEAGVTGKVGGVLEVRNSKIKGKSAGMYLQSLENGCTLESEFINTTISCTDHGVGTGCILKYPTTTSSGKLCGTDFSLAETSHGNNIAELNH